MGLIFQSLLNNTASIYSRRRTPDGQGGWVINYIYSGLVRCRVRPASSAEKTVAQQEERQITHVLYCVHGTGIARGDRVYVDDIYLDIQAIREPSRADEHLEIDCLERQGEVTEVGT